MIDKWTRFLEAAQATWMGTPSDPSASAIEPAQTPLSEPETAHHGAPSASVPQAIDDADQPQLTSATGSQASMTDTHAVSGVASTSPPAEPFEIHVTTTVDHGTAATGITADADVHVVVLPVHQAVESPVVAENPVSLGIAVDAHWHAEIASISAPVPSLSGAPVAAYAPAVQVTIAPAAIDTAAANSSPADAAAAPASLDNGDHVTLSVPAGWSGVPANQVLDALGGSGASVTGAGIKVGVLSDSFNDLGGAAADEADGALPSAASIQILKDAGSGGSDEGRAMMQIVHDIAPSAGLAFYTAFDSEQDFANGILALAAAGCKVICDDVSYYDEPFFQNGIVAQAIQTVEAEGVSYVTAAGNDGSAAYQAAWSGMSGTFDGVALSDAESFGGSIVQTMTVSAGVPLLLEWNQAYGHATSDLELLVFHNGSLIATATNQSVGEPTNPWTAYQFSASGTYQIAVENLSGPNPGLIKEIAAGDGLTAVISGANAGTVYGHAMTPGVISAGAVDSAVTPAFGYGTLANEPFSSSGAGTELLFANNGTALSSPLALSPVTVSGIDDISTTVSGGLHDFYGTSAASASLAGVAALILAANPSLTPAQVAEIMQDTAASMSNSAVAGAGLVQVDAAIAEAQSFLPHVIEATGSTKLVQVGLNDFLDPVSGGTGPELMFGGKAVTTTQLGGWQPIAAEAVGGGYEVAFKMQGQDLYVVWATDSSGNYTGNASGAVLGSSIALEALEPNFQQDLNGDGTIGVFTHTIETAGATSLVQTANNYFLNPVGGGTGPSLKYGGAAVIAGSLSGWTPIGAEVVGAGYDVAFKMQGQDLYVVWTTDSSGNYTGNASGAVSGSSIALETLETTLQQDLNGDGHIGVVSTTIEAYGATSLVQLSNNYLLDPVGGGTGPTLKYGGAAVIAGTLSGWTPIGAEAVGPGYEVAFKMQGQDLYTVWNTDGDGNYTGNATRAVAGHSVALEALETSFQQDLNGDGTTGIAPGAGSVASIQSSAKASSDASFDGHTLTLASPATFDGHIVGFGIGGTDQIDLNGIASTTLQTYFDSAADKLALSDGTTTAQLQFVGRYTQDFFHFADDGLGGTQIVATTATAPTSSPARSAQGDIFSGGPHDSFVFAQGFGQASIAKFNPLADSIAFSKSVFASQDALATAIHNDAAGNAVITDAAHDTITLPHVTAAELLAHLTDLHIV